MELEEAAVVLELAVTELIALSTLFIDIFVRLFCCGRLGPRFMLADTHTARKRNINKND